MTHSVVPDIEARLNLEEDNSREEMQNLLGKTDFFSNLTAEEIEIVAPRINVYKAKKGIKIFKQSERNTWLCILTVGKLLVIKHDGPGKDQDIAVITPGKCIGEMSLIDGEPLSATVVAAEDCKILLISSENFKKITKNHPELGNKLLFKIALMLTSRLRSTTTLLARQLS